MTTDDVLDQIMKAIEAVLPREPAAAAARTTKTMSMDAFFAYALGEIREAAREPATKARARLEALQRTVATAKASFEDTNNVTVEVTPLDTTANQELTEREISPLSVTQSGSGTSSWAENPQDLHKALEALRKQVEELQGSAPAAQAQPSTTREESSWPTDMNEAVQKRDVDWGRDPVEPEAERGRA